MHIYVIIEWDTEFEYYTLEGKSFIDKDKAEKYCEDNGWLEAEKVSVADYKTSDINFCDLHEEFSNKRYPRE
jgi:hypothetical protein